MRALVYHMNYIQSRKGVEEATKSLGSLVIQNPVDMNYEPHSQAIVPAEEEDLDINYEEYLDINFQPQDRVSNCPTCNSQDIEFDNTISRVVCMGYGKELPFSPFDIRNPEIEVM